MVLSALALGQTFGWLHDVAAETETAVILINHQSVDIDQIPLTWLNSAREQDIFFTHKSVGSNILDGMLDLQSVDAARYSINIVSTSASWFDTNSGIIHQQPGTNTDPLSKIAGFDALIRGSYHVADMAMMKLCPGDPIPFGTTPAATIWANYRDTMTALEVAYPDVTFVWWTFPLSTAADDRGNDEKGIFNALMRDYCDTHGCVLFDIADIQSHDPDGNPVTSSAGHEAMWNGYSYDGAHLNETGRQRIAGAFWWLFARIAGWEGVPAPSTDPDFFIELEPDVINVIWDRTAVFSVSIQGVGGYSDPVQLEMQNYTGGTAVYWGATTLNPGESTIITTSITQGMACKPYPFDIIGTSGAVSKTVTATLYVRQPHFIPLVVKGESE